MTSRSARIERETNETKIVVEIDLDGSGSTSVSTGVPFFDHMLDQLGRHSGFDLRVEATGDLEIDNHHTIEDVGLALGDALKQALGDKAGIVRYGSVTVPMEDALVMCALDLSGRPYLARDIPVPADAIGGYEPVHTNEFMRALVNRGGITLHSRLLDGRDPHHIVEGEFKALARALAQACARTGGVSAPSTKGVLE
ncbi:MAG TPA: imidazoleglycerol-phosphate dehydratase HisB [Actinomycetota bacterium]|nr:imidazoleglycerol-phosphate dehydratase HisB [Actinomycetota bacterium]